MEDKKEKEYIMYKITCNTDESLIYIGSTTNFRVRKNRHKNACINENYKEYSLKVYEMIRSNGGWINWTISPVEIYYSDNKTKAKIRENELMDEFKSNLNLIKAYISEEERKTNLKIYKNDNKEYYKQISKDYYIANKDIIQDYNKKYYEENMDNLKEQQKLYYKNNKEKSKLYYENNKHIINKKRENYFKQYNFDNKDKLSEKRKLTIICECGLEITKLNLQRHKKSSKHQTYLCGFLKEEPK